jgi:hypothetical protein
MRDGDDPLSLSPLGDGGGPTWGVLSFCFLTDITIRPLKVVMARPITTAYAAAVLIPVMKAALGSVVIG